MASGTVYPYTLPEPCTVEGEVVGGKRLGRTLGFPTANLALDSGADIRHGIYASRVRVGDEWYFAVSNVGVRPTVDGDTVNCETHVIDYEGDLYGRRIQVSLIALLRDETRFSSVEELKLAIEGDVRRAVSYFENGVK